MKSAGASGLALLVRPERAEAALWRRLRIEGDERCRLDLFDRYVGLARSIAANRYYRRARRGDRSDFEQFAFEGLLQAIDRYDPLAGVPFSAFARRRIVGSIVDGAGRMSEVDAQISHRVRIEQERVRALRRSGAVAEGRDALAELADLAMGLTLGLMLEGTAILVSGEGEDTRPIPYDSLHWRQLNARLAEEMARLPEREALIVRHHYENGVSFARIADLLGLSRGRVSQLHRAAMDRLRSNLGGFR
jgi:RNA polymerase sigma factor for flagellar operon FliA